MPAAYFENRSLPAVADLCIVMGTSLSVQPFASLPGFCAEGVPRLLINKERVGNLGSRPDDVLVLEDCDSGVRRLATALGWGEELEALWRETAPQGDVVVQPLPSKTKDEALEDEIAVLTKEVEEALRISKDYTTPLLASLSTNDDAKKDEKIEVEASGKDQNEPSKQTKPPGDDVDPQASQRAKRASSNALPNEKTDHSPLNAADTSPKKLSP